MNKFVLYISLFVFSFNFLKLMNNPANIPVEYSSITYLVAPALFLLRSKKLEIWAIYSSIMAGTFYYLTMILSGGNVYELYPHYDVYQSLYSHGSLLLLGLIKIRTVTLTENQSYKLIIGNLIIGTWAIVYKPYIIGDARLFIYELLEAKHVSIINISTTISIPLYYIALAMLVYGSSRWIYPLNRFAQKKNYKRISKRQLEIQY